MTTTLLALLKLGVNAMADLPGVITITSFTPGRESIRSTDSSAVAGAQISAPTIAIVIVQPISHTRSRLLL
jgi:hypothetical protein